MESDRESDSPISLKQLLDKLNSIESRMEDNFSNLHSQIAQLTHEFKEEINGVKNSLKKIEKSLNSARGFMEDLQQESKASKDSKSSHLKMLDEQASEILQFNRSLLKDEVYINKLHENIILFKNKYFDIDDLELKRGLIKMEIRGFTIKYSKLKAKKKKTKNACCKIK